MTTEFPGFPSASRIWIHVADRPLDDRQARELKEGMDRFAETWTSHARPVRGAVSLVDRRILVLVADVVDGDLSGCGIDKASRRLDRVASALGFSWLGALKVVYRDDEGTLTAVARSEFRSASAAGTISAETLVVDPTLTTLGEFRDGRMERRAGDSWHARLLAPSDTHTLRTT